MLTSALRVRPLSAVVIGGIVLSTLPACGDSSDSSSTGGPTGDATVLEAEILEEHDFDADAFTQGLEVMPEGDLLIGTGLNGESRIYRAPVEDATSPTVNEDLEEKYFGEGVTLHDDTVWQLTWKEGTAFQRDPETLEVTGEASYDGEGWGICSDGERLVTSDGSDNLTFRDPETFEPTGDVSVTLDGEPVEELNELECAGGSVWANIWHQDRIVRIDPESGDVTGVLDVDLPAGDRSGADVLNGIAAVPDKEDTFYLTGKLWDTVYEVRIDEA
ncbi:MAG TPA: glutaminyl-peptide cyclotransferase [Candidatus Corynebacterium avicola]|uniref:Glutaminyl-peptide cyclotransferase n=1 Tax=Candidatus Corynebacterium avicola TaxID=2838527 RepID=A0A9D1UK74_9CORY|nr:glutaminyl-peptide cyclotransferase [Candidatus Corynebacterium avicola]